MTATSERFDVEAERRRPCQFRRLPRDLVATSSSRRWGDQLPLRVETCQLLRNPFVAAPPCSSQRLPRCHRRCRASSTRSGNLLAARPMGGSIAARLGAQLACPAPLRDLEPCSERATGGYPALFCEVDTSKRSKPVQLSLLPIGVRGRATLPCAGLTPPCTA